MAELKSTQATRLGERLVNAGYIDEMQLERALIHQHIYGGLLGHALISLGILTQAQLDMFFRSNNRIWSGERLVEEGIITPSQLVQALNFQGEYGGRLGNAIVALGFASEDAIDAFFAQNLSNAAMRLGELLVNDGYLSQQQLEQALLFQRNSGGQLGEILLSMGMIKPEALYRTLATQMQLGRIGKTLDFNESKKLPYEIALKNNALIINNRPDAYVLAVHHSLDEQALAEIEMLLGKPVEQVLASMNEIEAFWEIVYQYEESDESVFKLYNEQPSNSAIVTFSKGQKIVGLSILALLVFSFAINYFTTLMVINIVLQSLYLVFTVLKVFILVRGLKRNQQLMYTPEQISAIDERELPVYTLLIPVYKEAEVAENLVKRLNALDYPKHKLDIRILLEKDDIETIEVFRSMNLPSYYTILVLPDTQPHTKPKACNYGLIRARGEYAVIYDAEDMPDSDQLKKAFLAFRDLPDSYVCIQSKLNYFNNDQNILTRWFTQEYSTWFNVLLIGIMTMDMPIPLGGTSNHFKTKFLREVGAWDPFNVTEDADLGIRLYKKHYHTAVLDSYTWEEANSKVGNWIRQRSRWIKGYMQTWLVHMRQPKKLLEFLGLKGFIGYQAMVLGTPLLPLLNPFFWVMLIIWFVFQPDFISSLFPGALYYIAAAQFIIGNFLFVYYNILGTYAVVRSKEISGKMHIRYSVILSGLLLPVYWIFMSIAGYKALIQLISKPYYWEKTHHGLTDQTTLNTTHR